MTNRSRKDAHVHGTGWAWAFLLLASVAGCGGSGNKPAPIAPPPPGVVVAVARQMNIPIEVREIGNTVAPASVEIRARVIGFIKERRFKEGSEVKKGDLLFLIEERPFQVAVNGAKASLAEFEVRLALARQGLEIQRAKAKHAQDKASLSLAELEVTRFKDLVLKSASTQQQVDEKVTRAKEAQAIVDADIAAVGQAELQQKTDIQRGEANIEIAKATLERAELDLGYCRIEAPIDGRIGRALVTEGNLVGAGQGEILATIQQTNPIDVQWQVNGKILPRLLRDFERLKKELGVRILISDDYQYPHAGTPSFIDNRVDPETATFTVKATFPNPEYQILPGLYVRIRLKLGERENVVVVPERAVVTNTLGSSVYVVTAENKVVITRVEASIIYEGVRVIEKGLKAGDRVIVEGTQLVRNDAVVSASEVPFGLIERNEKVPIYPSDPRPNPDATNAPASPKPVPLEKK